MCKGQGVYKNPACAENLRKLGYSEETMVRVSRGQGLRGRVGYAEEIGPQSAATFLGVSRKRMTWFAL